MVRITRLAMLFEGILATFAVGLGWILDVAPFAGLRWTWTAAGLGLAATAPPILGMLWSDRSAWAPLRRLREEMDRSLRPLFAACGWLDMLVIGTAAGFAEELLFRGVLQPAVGAAATPAVGLVAAATLFGLLHLVTPTYAVLAGVVGLYLGALLLLTGDLLVPMVTHAAYDVVALRWWLRRPVPETASAPPPDRPIT